MNAEQKRLAREIMADAVEKSDPGERAAFIEQACGTDPELRQLVDALVQAHDQAGGFLQQTIVVPEDKLIGEGPGTVIGRYKVLQEIGEGGFGRVFMAEQQEPVRRKVAFKIIKVGMDTREVIARFEAEQQALALMDHPNIARVLDAGATETGRPYFVMELVKGIPMTAYCDEHNLGTEDRLQLFMKVCHAVQHAHQKGIIHRDLKPSNVLVTVVDGEAVPKVIDFGIAKAMGQQLTDKTLFTRFEQMTGTPAYMSPEQAALSGVDVDTRSDIYSLGVLLYELLTGTTPVERDTLKQAAFDEIRRLIRETEAPKPSTRLQTLGEKLTEVAKHRQVEPEALRRTVRGDLDWIVMKALEKDRSRRYETANDFAQDIQRHLQHDLVVACPPSAGYRARKFIRRNRVAVAIAASVTVALLTGLAVALVGFNQARKERDRALAAERKAESEADIAKAVNNFIQKDLLAQANPLVSGDPDLTLRTVLDRAAARISWQFTNQPLVEASIRSTIGEAFFAVSEYKLAGLHSQQAVELRRQALGPEHPLTLEALHLTAASMICRGRYSEAEVILRRLAEVYPRVCGPDDPEALRVMNTLGNLYGHLDRIHESVVWVRKSLEGYRRLPGREEDATWMMANLARCLKNQGAVEEAEKLLQEAAQTCVRVLGPDHPNMCRLIQLSMAELSESVGRYEEARILWAEVAKGKSKLLGARHRETMDARRWVADLSSRLGDWKTSTECYDVLSKIEGEDSIFRGAISARLAGQSNVCGEMCRSIVRQFAQPTNAAFATRVSMALLLLPEGAANLDAACQLANMALEAKPESLWRQTCRGMAAYRLGRWQEALTYLEAPARDRDPEISCLPGYFAAMARQELGQAAAARATLEDISGRLALALHRGDLGRNWDNLGRALVARAEAERRILGREVSPPVTADSLATARENWTRVGELLKQGNILAKQRQWKAARDAYARALAHPAFLWDAAEEQSEGRCLSLKMGVAFVKAGDPATSEKHCRFVLSLEDGDLSKRRADIYAKTCLMNWKGLPLQVRERAVELARHAASRDKMEANWASWWLCHTAGMAEYYAGNYQRALELLEHAEKSDEAEGRIACKGGAKIYKGMVLKKLGREQEAGQVLTQAEQLLAEPLQNRSRASWWDLDICELSLMEARELFGQTGRK